MTAYAFYMAEQSLEEEKANVQEMDAALSGHKKTVKSAQTDIDNEKQNIEITKAKREAVSMTARGAGLASTA